MALFRCNIGYFHIGQCLTQCCEWRRQCWPMLYDSKHTAKLAIFTLAQCCEWRRQCWPMLYDSKHTAKHWPNIGQCCYHWPNIGQSCQHWLNIGQCCVRLGQCWPMLPHLVVQACTGRGPLLCESLLLLCWSCVYIDPACIGIVLPHPCPCEAVCWPNIGPTLANVDNIGPNDLTD